jgi:hypothetical protein
MSNKYQACPHSPFVQRDENTHIHTGDSERKSKIKI